MELLTDKTIQSILDALHRGLRVELVLQKDGTIAVQTIQRKKLKT